MLRILVISLFVANLLLLGFQRNKSAVQEETVVAPAVKKNSGVPTIHLFGEMMQDQDLLTGNRQCFSLGPFHSSEDKDEVHLLLQEVSTRISERQTEALVEKGYWVFMPSYESLLEANEALISLQALGLEDIGVIYDGDWKNAISLGYFMRQENAQRRKKSIESRGYEPMMRVQRQGEPRYWLDYEQPTGSGLIAIDMQNRPNDFMQRSLPCPEEDIVNVPQERVETPLIQAVETEPEAAIGNESGDAIETEPEGAAGTGQEDSTENVPESAVVTGQDDGNETEPENTVVTGQEDTIETEADDAVGTGQEDNTETEPENAVETAQQDNIETEPENAAETGQQDNTETVPENAVETAQQDTIGTEPENAVETGQENIIETGTEDAIDNSPRNSVGTGPQDAIETEPESAVETGLDDALESGQEPVDETVPDEPGETGTGEG